MMPLVFGQNAQRISKQEFSNSFLHLWQCQVSGIGLSSNSEP